MRSLMGFYVIFSVILFVSCANNELGKVDETDETNDESVDESVQTEEETADTTDDELSDDLSDEALAESEVLTESEVSDAESEETTDEESAEIQLKYKESDEKAEAVENDLVNSNTEFALKMFKALLEADKDKNVFISPVSI